MESENTRDADRFWPAGTKPLKGITEAALAFIVEHSRLLDLVSFYQGAGLESIKPMFDIVRAERKQLDGAIATDMPMELGSLDQNIDELGKRVDKLQELSLLLNEIMLSRTADNFLSYLSDLLSMIYKARPEMMKSNEKESLEFILQYQTMDELRGAIAERKVERLAYLGLRDLDAQLEGHMGFKLFEDPVEAYRAALVVEFRNLLTHNRGVVSPLSGRRFTQLTPLVGTRLKFTSEEIRDWRKALEHAVFDIDSRAAQKFALPVKEFREPPPELM